MPESEVNIGGEYENTWGAVRCLLYKGTGYRGETMPNNKNWSRVLIGGAINTPFSSGYIEPVTPIMRAFPMIKFANTSLGYSTSMSLGVRVISGEGAEGNVRNLFFLCAGESIATFDVARSRFYEEVFKGYGNYGPGPDSGAVGYDINSMRTTMADVEIVIKFYPGPGISEVTETVTLDSENIVKLFPDDMSADLASTEPGIPIGDYQYPDTRDPYDWVQPFWTIESVTYP